MSTEAPKRRLWHAALRELVRFYAQLQHEGEQRRREAGVERRLRAIEDRLQLVERDLSVILAED